MTQKWISVALVLPLSGGLYALAFLPDAFPQQDFLSPFLVLTSLALMFWMLRSLMPQSAFLLGFVHGYLAYGISASWFWEIFGALSFALFGILASFHAVFAVAEVWVWRRAASPWVAALTVACLWTGIEFVRGELFWLKFPWFGVGVARGPHWLLPWVGVYGMTFLGVLGLALCLRRRTLFVGIVMWVVWLWQSSKLEPLPSDDEPGALRVTAVQAETGILKTYLTLSEQASIDGAGVILWPEYAYPSDLAKNPRDNQSVLDFLAQRPGMLLVLGTQTWEEGTDWRNTALTLSAEGPLGRHFKNHTVHLFDDGVPGTEAKAIPTPLGTIGTPVCFDCDFQDVVRRMTASGAEVILSPTMDAASWTERQHEQHARLFQLRAAENARWLVVAASSGVTQVIDPQGHVRARLPLLVEDTITATVLRKSDLTFYTRYGHFFPWLMYPMLFLLIVRMRVAKVGEKTGRGEPSP